MRNDNKGEVKTDKEKKNSLGAHLFYFNVQVGGKMAPVCLAGRLTLSVFCVLCCFSRAIQTIDSLVVYDCRF